MIMAAVYEQYQKAKNERLSHRHSDKNKGSLKEGETSSAANTATINSGISKGQTIHEGAHETTSNPGQTIKSQGDSTIPPKAGDED